MKRALKRSLRRPHALLSMFLFDPLEVLNKWRALGFYARNARRYRRANGTRSFDIHWRDLWYRSYDRFAEAGSVTFHYFFQDLWAASRLHEHGVRPTVAIYENRMRFRRPILADLQAEASIGIEEKNAMMAALKRTGHAKVRVTVDVRGSNEKDAAAHMDGRYSVRMPVSGISAPR